MATFLHDRYNHQVEVYNYMIPKDVKGKINNYDIVIAGSSIVAGFWKSGIKKFLKKYRDQIKNLVIYVTAAGTLRRASENGEPKEEAILIAKEKYIKPVKKKYNLDSLFEGVFGGEYAKGGKVKFNNWNPEDIKYWVQELQIILKKSNNIE